MQTVANEHRNKVCNPVFTVASCTITLLYRGCRGVSQHQQAQEAFQHHRWGHQACSGWPGFGNLSRPNHCTFGAQWSWQDNSHLYADWHSPCHFRQVSWQDLDVLCICRAFCKGQIPALLGHHWSWQNNSNLHVAWHSPGQVRQLHDRLESIIRLHLCFG